MNFRKFCELHSPFPKIIGFLRTRGAPSNGARATIVSLKDPLIFVFYTIMNKKF